MTTRTALRWEGRISKRFNKLREESAKGGELSQREVLRLRGWCFADGVGWDQGTA